MIKISHLAINSTESLEHDQNYDQQAKDTLFWNWLQCLLFLVSIAGPIPKQWVFGLLIIVLIVL